MFPGAELRLHARRVQFETINRTVTRSRGPQAPNRQKVAAIRLPDAESRDPTGKDLMPQHRARLAFASRAGCQE